jgi:hypothetical protein
MQCSSLGRSIRQVHLVELDARDAADCTSSSLCVSRRHDDRRTGSASARIVFEANTGTATGHDRDRAAQIITFQHALGYSKYFENV